MVYRIPARVGAYKISAELQGFTTIVREGLQLLVGETLVVNLPAVAIDAAAETIIVTAEAAAPERLRRRSSAAISIRKQVQEMPSGGATGARCCCWRPGAAPTGDTVARINLRNTDRIREFQTNVDGQQFQNTMGGGGQPTFSQGDDRGIPVHLQSIRCDAGPFLGPPGQPGHEVWDQQLCRVRSEQFPRRSVQRGRSNPPSRDARPEPAVRIDIWRTHRARNRLHFFAYDEYEREPEKEETWRTSQFAVQRLVAGHVQEEDRRHPPRLPDLAAEPGDGPLERGEDVHTASAPATPAIRQGRRGWENSDQLAVQLTNVLSNRTVNELMVGHAGFLVRGRKPDALVPSLAGAGQPVRSHHDRFAPHHVHELHHRRQCRAPRAIEPRIVPGEGQLDHRTTRAVATT